MVKQPREKTVNAIGQTTMINRSRMRDVGDTRQDFEELGDAIGAGLYLKEGMNREGQDFYYMHTLIEVIADDPDTLEQRVTAVETLCVASDMLAKRCEYKHEAAFLSFLPLLISDPDTLPWWSTGRRQAAAPPLYLRNMRPPEGSSRYPLVGRLWRQGHPARGVLHRSRTRHRPLPPPQEVRDRNFLSPLSRSSEALRPV